MKPEIKIAGLGIIISIIVSFLVTLFLAFPYFGYEFSYTIETGIWIIAFAVPAFFVSVLLIGSLEQLKKKKDSDLLIATIISIILAWIATVIYSFYSEKPSGAEYWIWIWTFLISLGIYVLIMKKISDKKK